MLLELIIAAAVAIAAFGLIWLLRGIILTPVPKSRNVDISIVLGVKGEAAELENMVKALCWLRKNGTIKANIFIRDEGMGEDTAQVARLFARSGTIDLI